MFLSHYSLFHIVPKMPNHGVKSCPMLAQTISLPVWLGSGCKYWNWQYCIFLCSHGFRCVISSKCSAPNTWLCSYFYCYIIWLAKMYPVICQIAGCTSYFNMWDFGHIRVCVCTSTHTALDSPHCLMCIHIQLGVLAEIIKSIFDKIAYMPDWSFT